jgi:hypothetical protein
VVATAGRRFDLHRESDIRTAGSHRVDVTESATAEEPDNCLVAHLGGDQCGWCPVKGFNYGFALFLAFVSNQCNHSHVCVVILNASRVSERVFVVGRRLRDIHRQFTSLKHSRTHRMAIPAVSSLQASIYLVQTDLINSAS